MDSKLLTFLALCNTRHYHHAAEQLHITQPAVTQHIKSLEAMYHCQLFTRQGRDLILTPAGERLLQFAQESQYREKELLETLAQPQEPMLHIGATKTIGAYILHHLLGPFLADPAHQATICVENTAVLLSMLNHNELDFALIEGFFDKTAYDWRLFRREPFVGICSKAHPFAGREITFDELLSETLFLREPGSGTRAVFEQILYAHNLSITQFARAICISDFALITALVAANAGISFVYQAVAESHPGLSTFSITNQQILREFHCVYLRHTNASSRLEYFLASTQS